MSESIKTSVEFGCSKCGRAIEGAPGETLTCRHCDAETPVPEAGNDLEKCLACGCEHIYRHRDFNQKMGLLLIAVGAGLCFVWPYWPLGVAALIDLVLYVTLPDVGICHRCKAHHRGFDNIGRLPAFDLERHEHYRFEKAKEEGRIASPDAPDLPEPPQKLRPPQ